MVSTYQKDFDKIYTKIKKYVKKNEKSPQKLLKLKKKISKLDFKKNNILQKKINNLFKKYIMKGGASARILPEELLSEVANKSNQKKNIEARKYIYTILRMVDELIPNLTRKQLPELVKQKKAEIQALINNGKINLSKAELSEIINTILTNEPRIPRGKGEGGNGGAAKLTKPPLATASSPAASSGQGPALTSAPLETLPGATPAQEPPAQGALAASPAAGAATTPANPFNPSSNPFNELIKPARANGAKPLSGTAQPAPANPFNPSSNPFNELIKPARANGAKPLSGIAQPAPANPFNPSSNPFNELTTPKTYVGGNKKIKRKNRSTPKTKSSKKR